MNSWKKYLIEVTIIFIGVFGAFLLNNYQQSRIDKKRQQELYQAIYEELDRFYQSGVRQEGGFIQFFENLETQIDSSLMLKKVPVRIRIYGDDWKIEIIDTIIKSGLVTDLDIEAFKKLSRFNTTHQNFLAYIEDFNQYYLNQITASYSDNMESYFVPNSTKLKARYQSIYMYENGFSAYAKELVNKAELLKNELKSDYLN